MVFPVFCVYWKYTLDKWKSLELILRNLREMLHVIEGTPTKVPFDIKIHTHTKKATNSCNMFKC